MTLYYESRDVRITDEVFESRRPRTQRFLIRDLQFVHAVRRTPVDALLGRESEIRGFYRGSLVCLFCTKDRIVFGQVSRALLRVLELTGEPAA